MITLRPLNNTAGVTQQEYDVAQETLIPITTSTSEFNPETDRVVFSLETLSGDLLFTNPSPTFNIQNYNGTTDIDSISSVVVFPIQDAQNAGYNVGSYNVFYNFYKVALNSTQLPYFIQEISPSRTEIRLSVNNVSTEEIGELYQSFSSSLQTSEGLFKDFYLNVEEAYYIANNVYLDNNTILIKLYQPLPSSISTSTQAKVMLEAAETVGFNLTFPVTPLQANEDIEYIDGPNFNINILDEVNNSTLEQDYTSLTSDTSLSSSYDELQNLLTQKGITINVDYTDFSNFIHFSSAEQRVLNFYYKVSQIESYNDDITTILTITGSTSSSFATSASISTLRNNITDIISKFDGYENYLYYTSESLSYPKSNATQPYILQSTGSSEVQTWLSNLTSSAYIYDSENQDNLWYTVPTYLREDPINAQYELFVEMIGQHFDNIYVYIDSLSKLYSGDNRLDYGISKDLVSDALKSLGVKLYQNNFSSDDLYSALLGINASGSLLPPTGSELIETYITASNVAIPLDNINKETYKRLYHNLPYLLNKKGTPAGLRALINCFGIPDTILRISEFGGKDKINLGAKDYTQEVFNLDTLTTSSVSSSQPLVGIKNRISDKIRIYTGSILEGDTLSYYQTAQSNPEERTTDINYIEVAFSPQNEINDLLTMSLNIGEYIGDPRFQSSSLTSYPLLDAYRDTTFADLTYTQPYNWKDYIRLIKYFDNSLFKMIKDFVPARSEVSTGVVIKQHMLERNRVRPPQAEVSQYDYSGSIESGFISGGSAGVYDNLPNKVTQSWSYEVNTQFGPTILTQSTQDEFYNGELSGSNMVVTDGNLNNTRVVETADINEGFIAPYNQVYSNNYFNSNGNFTYNTNENFTHITSLIFHGNDSNGNSRFNYLTSFPNIPFKPGDSLYIKTIESDGTEKLFIFQIETVYNGPINPSQGSTQFSVIPFGNPAYGGLPSPWNETGEGLKDFTIEVIKDTVISNLQANLKGDEPLQNNALTPIQSNIYQDIDYSTSAIKPVNFGQLINNTAVKAAVQDSNYSQKGWSNSRYNGSRISSPDFNITV